MSEMIPSNPRRSDATSDNVRPSAAAKKTTAKKKAGPRHKRRDESDRTDRQPIASDEDCLSALSRTPGLIAMGMLNTAQANSIRGVYSTILGHHQRAKSATSEQKLNDGDVLDILRKSPELLSMLEPLLTEEQIAMVMRGGTDTADEQA